MKIFVSNDVSPAGVEVLKKHPEFQVDVMPNLSEDELVKIIGDYDAMLTRSQIRFTKRLIDAGTNLKVIGRCGVGVDNIDIPAATARGIVVCNTPESNTIAATEHTCAMIMAITRHVPQAHQSIQEGKWDRKSFDGIQLQGKTLGIIGVGRIGSRVAKRMQAMEMTTIGYDPYITEERAHQVGVKLVDLDTLLATSDYITIHTPLTKETTNMINAEAIAKMKDGVRFINVARGKCMDADAVAAALKSGKIAGAAIDVYPKEPLTAESNPFLGMFNVVQTPHLGASTVEAQISVSVDGAHGVIEALEGRPVMTAVNMSPIPREVAQVIQPYFPLAERIGNIGIYLAEGPISEVEIEYTGELAETEIQALSTAVIKGLLNPILQESVNFVNAPQLAKRRNIDVREIKSHKQGYFSTTIKLKVVTNKGEHTVMGTLFDGKEPKIVRIDDYHVDFSPKGILLLLPHADRPNMIGQMATILGGAGININGMVVGKTIKDGTNIMAIAVGDDIPNNIMLQLRGIEGILDVKLIDCRH
ncbi:MAG: phosphoglycerate dehydrogenase [Selenomonadaceae bacterium]|nr:phosphoglycerate dehydrogenase [Selenomonadaceae bacterium]